jgi:hypothetical protein
MTSAMLRAAVVAAFAAFFFCAGWLANGWRLEARAARAESARVSAAEAMARKNFDALVEAERQGEVLSARVAVAETARDIALQEAQNALLRVTTGRACLGNAAVRLLNGAARADLKPPLLPAPAGAPAGADAAAASDTDVAFWAASAIRHYDTCRGRLAALAEFYEDLTDAPIDR